MTEHNGSHKVRDEQISTLKGNVEKILDNHLPHIQSELNDLSTKITEHGVKIAWQSKLIWAVLLASVGGLVAAVFQILFK